MAPPRPRGPRRWGRPSLALVLLAACWQAPAPPPAPPSPGATPPAPSQPPPAARTPADPFVELAAFSQHACARRQSGAVECWGEGSHGQLGQGKREGSARPVAVVGLRDAVELAVGSDFSCARRKAGGVVCWGNDEFGQLGGGRGVEPGALSLRPVAVVGLRQPVQLTAGESHACALEQGGTVQCWGDARDGQIGSDAQHGFARPLPIAPLGPAARVAAGASHVCALATTGVVDCWGRNTEGELGDGKSGSRIKPVRVAGLEHVVDLAAGHHHTCARQQSGRVWCWGDNHGGQLGQGAGTAPKRGTPVEVPGLRDVVELAGGGDHTCARLRSGRAMCWGSNAAGQLGLRATVARAAEPTAVRGMGDAVDLALAATATCALRKTGELACVGASLHAPARGTI
jgi:alpha-tubulin suppressor-like RCC1 family protein